MEQLWEKARCTAVGTSKDRLGTAALTLCITEASYQPRRDAPSSWEHSCRSQCVRSWWWDAAIFPQSHTNGRLNTWVFLLLRIHGGTDKYWEVIITLFTRVKTPGQMSFLEFIQPNKRKESWRSCAQIVLVNLQICGRRRVNNQSKLSFYDLCQTGLSWAAFQWTWVVCCVWLTVFLIYRLVGAVLNHS